MIDLHVHTDASSDGVHTPEEIFEMSARLGVKGLAFADHNNTDNVDKGLKLSKKYNIPFVPAVEINSTHLNEDIHIIGYFIDHRSSEMVSFLSNTQNEIIAQTKKRVALLREYGFVLNTDDVLRESKGKPPTGRSFLTAILKKEENAGDKRLKNYVDGDRSDSPSLNFYLDFLSGGKPAYIPLSTSTTKGAVEIISISGGLSVIAHPGEYPRGMLDDLVALGADGIEVYSGHHNKVEEKYFKRYAMEKGLLMTAGSDFHGKIVKPTIDLGVKIEGGEEMFEKLKKAHEEKYA
ncbi:MAG: PHP domain-containing protein [Deltaproteobacteria bacterium]|uniref:PHP domain-containing protein n=1 Tax=Candidatus Zymogenus saltonus TaxID=2844893 RepID=A0A9D8KE46_9DELT|nr:PHP domain-containing protein [Candidatus Zymogenus saltonus]